MALLASVAAFAHIFAGLTNKALRAHMAALWQPGYSSAQATYDLRRLRLKGFIERVQGTHTYRVTPRACASRPSSPTSPPVSSSPPSPTSPPPTPGPRARSPKPGETMNVN